MSAPGSDASEARAALVRTRWLHVDGDDDAHGAVYRDADGDIPLSRRPKEILEFGDDGTVRKLATGADDRAHEVDRATWHHDDGRVTFRFGATDHEVVEQTADRLVVRRG